MKCYQDIYPDVDMKRWECDGSVVIADADNYYTKAQTDALIDDVSGMTPQEVEAIVDEAVSGFTTDEEVDAKIASAKTEIEGEIPSLSGYATQEYVDEKDAEKLSVSDFNTYSGTVASSIGEKASQSDLTALSAQVETVISGEVTSADVQTQIDSSISGKADSSAVTSVNDALTAHAANATVHVSTAQTSAWDAKSNFSGSYNDLTDKPTIPSIWSGTEAQWSQISGGTLDNNCIYLVY